MRDTQRQLPQRQLHGRLAVRFPFPSELSIYEASRLRPSSRADHLHTCSEGLETECRKRSHFNTQYEFEAGPEKYRWRADSVNKSMYNYTVRAFLSPPRVKAECVRYLQLWKDSEMELPESERTPVAHWRTAWAAVVKAGCLLINPVRLRCGSISLIRIRADVHESCRRIRTRWN